MLWPARRQNLNMLDRFLITMQVQHVDTVICFNKTDVSCENEIQRLGDIYKGCGCRVLFTSVENGEGLLQVRELLTDKTTVMAGPFRCGEIFHDELPEAGGCHGKRERSAKKSRGAATRPVILSCFIWKGLHM